MKNIFILLLLMLPLSIFAQDIIFKTDGTRLEAKVQEVSDDEIRYKLFSNLDGPVYVIDRDEIEMIAYQNGTHESFNTKAGKLRALDDSLARNKSKNVISLDMFDLVFTNVAVSYERIFGKGYIGVKVPVSLGMSTLSGYNAPSNGTYTANRLWGTGIDLNFYPNGQGKVSYYLGPAFIVGAYKYSYYTPYFGSYIYPPHTQFNLTGYHFAVVINNGIRLQPTKHMNISMAVGLGLREDMTRGYDYIKPKGTFSATCGYRF